MMRIRAYGVGIALAVVFGVAVQAGVDADLVFKRITASETARVKVDDLTVPLDGGAEILLVRNAEPTAIKDGEYVSSSKQPGDGAPNWLLLGGDSKQVQRLIESAGIKTSEPKKVGGIGTCGLYTPCPKCRRGFQETVARRQLHPLSLRVQTIPASEIKVGQFLAVADLSAGRRPLLVFADERAFRALNEIRALATRSNRLIH